MTTSEIISLVASVGAVASAIAAIFSCVIHIKTTVPKINLRIHQTMTSCYYLYYQTKTECKTFACMHASIVNNSPVAGTIADVTLIYDKRKFSSETVGSHYDTGIVKQKLGISNDYIQDKEFFRYKTPIIIPPYSAKLGYFIFPTFPIVNKHKISVTVEVKIIHKKVITKRYTNVIFNDITYHSGTHMTYGEPYTDYNGYSFYVSDD